MSDKIRDEAISWVDNDLDIYDDICTFDKPSVTRHSTDAYMSGYKSGQCKTEYFVETIKKYKEKCFTALEEIDRLNTHYRGLIESIRSDSDREIDRLKAENEKLRNCYNCGWSLERELYIECQYNNCVNYSKWEYEG